MTLAPETTAKPTPPLLRVPRHVALIMDGNGRWAAARGLPRLAGHRAGTENLRTIITAAVEIGIKYLTIYAFSTENWGRPQDEVSGLMFILADVIDRELTELHQKGVCLRHIGQLERLEPGLRKKVASAIELTQHNDRLVLSVAFNYGGRDEIIHAIRDMVADGLKPEQISEEVVNRYLYTAGVPDPDLIIRTSGEMRLSNFLIWQAAYAEWYVTPTLWPDFGKEELLKAINDFAQRDRRYGRLSQPD
ncbi:MAG: isoprenyl transferase [Anaerolineaceae bacterium]|jgi:undecaprenyl diphosphate synthase